LKQMRRIGSMLDQCAAAVDDPPRKSLRSKL
jgi:hypothetical protein